MAAAAAAFQQQDNEHYDDKERDEPEHLHPAWRRHGVPFRLRGGVGH